MIGLLVTGQRDPDRPLALPGNTRDSTTLQQVMADYQARFGVGRLALVADRDVISEQNLADAAAAGFDHVLATDSTTTATSWASSSVPQLSATTRGARCRALRERRPSR